LTVAPSSAIPQKLKARRTVPRRTRMLLLWRVIAGG
jgi:hypothetical protein